MHLFDVIRFIAFFTFGLGMGLCALTNVIAYKVLRPPERLGFLWWHVTSISLSFGCIGVVAVEAVASRLGNPPSWRGVVVLVGTTLFLVAQAIIFKVEKQRLVYQKAQAQLAAVASNER